MLEKDQPVRDGTWTPAEIALINEKIQLITTKPVIYLVNLTMKDYLRQKSKYLPQIAKWVTEHGGLPRDIIPFSVEFEEKLYSMKDDPAAQEAFLNESKVKSRLGKMVTEGFTKLGLQYYFTGWQLSPILARRSCLCDKSLTNENPNQLVKKRSGAGPFRKAVWHHRPPV